MFIYGWFKSINVVVSGLKVKKAISNSVENINTECVWLIPKQDLNVLVIP